MYNQPSVAELVQAVKNFIDDTAAPNLEGHAAFHARVASNTLATVLRDLEARLGNERDETTRLHTLLGDDTNTSIDDMNRQLSANIQSGEMDIATPGLLAHLKATTIAQIEVDQPNYSGLKAAKS